MTHLRRRRSPAGLGWRLGAWVALLGALLLVCGGTLFAVRLWPDSPRAEGELRSERVASEIEILRDVFGVPHVRAEDRRGALLGLGFAHAQDRLWQLELLRRSSRGTLSEVFGSSTVEADRMARTLGLARRAAQERARLPEPVRLDLEAYADGINLWIDLVAANRAPAPVEFRWLAISPERWSVDDTLALVRLRAWMLGRSLSASLLLDRLVREIGGLPSQPFFPARRDPQVTGTGRGILGRLLEYGRIADRWAAAIGLRGPVGSGGFVVGGKRSANGMPLLANDPHTEFGLPPLFYLAHLSTPGWDVAGGTWPGIPAFWAGSNREIAWGQVVLHASTTDLYEETLHPADRYRYERGGRWFEVERRHETVVVRYASDEEIEIVETHHGPILGSVAAEHPSAASLALQWTGQAATSGIEGLLRIPEAHSFKQFRRALRKIPAPVATHLYADRSGVIGMQVAGRLPVRPIETGLLPVRGNSRLYDWRGFIPFDALPSVHGKELSYLVASGRPPASDFDHPVVWLWSRPVAAQRLRERLEAAAAWDLADVVALQRERRSGSARPFLRTWLHDLEPRSQRASRIREILLAWDGSTDGSSVGAATYHVFRELLLSRLLRDHLSPEHAALVRGVREPFPGAALGEFFDRADARRVDALAHETLDATWPWRAVEVSSNPKNWRWDAIHEGELLHDFARLGSGLTASLGRILSRGPFGVPGDPESVWTMYPEGIGSFRVAVGPVLRYAVDLGDPDHAVWDLAGGQSGHPFDPRYDDGIEDWIERRPRPLWMLRRDVAYHDAAIWRLLPAEP